MKKMLYFLILLFVPIVYLFCMNSTENRQRLADQELITYLNYKRFHINKFPHDPEKMIARCYAVYNSLLDMRNIADSYDPDIKIRLVATGFCEVDESHLVLKGFPIEDSLKVLIGCERGKKK